MLIEIFTDGRVLIDGQVQGPRFKAEKLLKEYLLNPDQMMILNEKKKAA